MGALTTKPKAIQHDEGVMAIAVDGGIVLVDTNDFTFDGKTPAVVVREDNSIGIEKPVPYGTGVRGMGPRMSAYGVGRLDNGRFRAIHPCTVLGRVIDGGQRRAPKGRIDHLIAQISLAIEEEYGGDWSVTIESGGRIDYRWGATEAA